MGTHIDRCKSKDLSKFSDWINPNQNLGTELDNAPQVTKENEAGSVLKREQRLPDPLKGPQNLHSQEPKVNFLLKLVDRLKDVDSEDEVEGEVALKKDKKFSRPAIATVNGWISRELTYLGVEKNPDANFGTRNLNSKAKNFECFLCLKKFVYFKSLSRHLEKH